MFVFIPQGGLCNRMRSLDSAMSVSSAAGAELVVEWYIDPNLMSEQFENLFEMPDEISKITTKHYTGRLGKHQKSIQRRLNKIKYKHCLYERDLSAFLKNGGDLIELARSGSLCIASCMHFYKDEPLFRRFTPIPEIRNEVERIMGGRSTVVGLHIRTDDQERAIHRGTIELELFENAMKKEIDLQSNVRFFLGTDSVKTEEYLKQKYGERIIVHNKSSLDRDSAIAMKDATIDLYCLSKASKIIGSLGSSFSDVAAQIKDIDLVMLDNALIRRNIGL